MIIDKKLMKITLKIKLKKNKVSLMIQTVINLKETNKKNKSVGKITEEIWMKIISIKDQMESYWMSPITIKHQKEINIL